MRGRKDRMFMGANYHICEICQLFFEDFRNSSDRRVEYPHVGAHIFKANISLTERGIYWLDS